MEHEAIIRKLNGQRQALETLGFKSLSLFGSSARNEMARLSDVDIAVTLDERAGLCGFSGACA